MGRILFRPCRGRGGICRSGVCNAGRACCGFRLRARVSMGVLNATSVRAEMRCVALLGKLGQRKEGFSCKVLPHAEPFQDSNFQVELLEPYAKEQS